MPGAPTELPAPRADFPLLAGAAGKVNYLDNAAATQQPRVVSEAVARLVGADFARVERSVHSLGERATRAFTLARVKVSRWLRAADSREVIFTRSATEALNLAAGACGKAVVGAGDEVLVTSFEHHSNLVPWQVLCRERGARLRVAPVGDGGRFDLDAFAALLGPRTRLVAAAHVAGATGTVLPLREIAALAHERGALVVADGAFAAARVDVDVGALGCDFYALSAAKMYGPTGIGALWGRLELLERLAPWQTGGDMVRSVTFQDAEYAAVPQRFEAGSPNVEGAVGWGAAIDYLEALRRERIAAHDASLVAHARERLARVRGLKVLAAGEAAAGAVAFTAAGVHPHDIATVLDQEGIAIGAGYLCSQPLLDAIAGGPVARIAVGVYNSLDDIDACAAAIERAADLFR